MHIHGHAFEVAGTDGGWVSKAARWPEVTVDIAEIRLAQKYNGEKLDAIITRLGYNVDNIANARRGIATGFTQPRSTIDQVLARAREQAAAPS